MYALMHRCLDIEMGAKKDQNTYLEEKLKDFKGRVRFHDLKATFSVKFNDEDSSISRFKARLYYAGWWDVKGKDYETSWSAMPPVAPPA